MPPRPRARRTLRRRDAARSDGRNDALPVWARKKYKKCHLAADDSRRSSCREAPDAKELAAAGWRLFQQRRPGPAEKDFRAALAADASLLDARVGIGMARLSAGNADGAKAGAGHVIEASESEVAKLRAKGAKDAFSDAEAQTNIRAANALGCLAYDETASRTP